MFRKDFRSLESFSNQSQNEILNEVKRVDRLYEYFKCREYFAQKSISKTDAPISILIQLENLLVIQVAPYEIVEAKVRELFKKL